MSSRVDSAVSASTYDVHANDNQATTVQYDETTLVQVAQRLGIDPNILLQANPQIADPNRLITGTQIQIPRPVSDRTVAGTATSDGSATNAQPATGKRVEAGMNAIAMRNMLSAAPAGSTAGRQAASDAASADAADATASAETQTPIDPRFAAFNAALEAGNGAAAVDEANKLITSLQAEKPPQPQLLSEARMSLAAGSMLAGNLDAAQKALLAIDPKKLSDTDKQQFGELRDLLADAHRQAFSDAFKTDSTADPAAPGRGQAAADQAKSLLELLQKTDPGNSAAINETRLKLANAQLMGTHYRDADKTLTGINEKQLPPEAKQYLNDMRKEVHAQQIDALGHAYDSEMKHHHYKEAVSDATALVNDLTKYFPEAKASIMASRLQQATAQIMNDDVAGGSKSLSHISRDQFQAAPKELQQRYKELTSFSDKYLETEKRQKADQADFKNQLDTIQRLVQSPDKGLVKDGVALAERLLNKIKEKYPTNTEAIESMELTVANAQLAAGDSNGAVERLQKLINTTQDSDVKEQAQLMEGHAYLEGHQTGKANQVLQSLSESTSDGDIKDQANILLAQGALQGHQTDKAVQMLRSASESASTPEARKEAKTFLVRIERNYLKAVYDKAGAEKQELDATLHDKWGKGGSVKDPDDESEIFLLGGSAPRFAGPIIDAVSMDQHVSSLNDLSHLQTGVRLAATVMKANNLTVGELQKMSLPQLSKLAGVNEADARKIQQALNNSDVKTVASNDFDGKHFSWDKGTLYVDPSYLDTPSDIAGKVIGKGLRALREGAQKLEDSGIPVATMAGHNVGRIMDGLSAANSFVKDKIKIAYDFYQHADHDGAWYGKLGMAATFAGDQVSSIFTMPATIVDYKASDEERSGAITGTTMMAFGDGLLKAGGPAFAEFGRGIAGSRLGRVVANSWVGKGAQWVAKGAVKLERGFERTGVAQTVDKLKTGLSKLTKPNVVGPKAIGDGSLEIHPKMSNVMIDSGIKGFDMDKLLKELERTDAGSQIAGRIRSGEAHVVISREPLGNDATVSGASLGNEIYVTWKGSVEEAASTAIHEGTHGNDPTTTPGGGQVSEASWEAVAREAEYEYRIKAGLPKSGDPIEDAYRDTLDNAKKSGATDADARLAAEKALVQALQADPYYGQGGASGVGRSQTGMPPSKNIHKALDEVMGGNTAEQMRASITPKEIKAIEDGLIKSKRKDVTSSIKKTVIEDLRRAGTPPAEIATKAKDMVDEVVKRDFPESRLRKLVEADFSPQDIQRMALSERIYDNVYHTEYPEKIANVSAEAQTSYAQKLDASKGPLVDGNDDLWRTPDGKSLISEDSYWHHRVSNVNGSSGLSAEAIQSGDGIRRFYFNLKPEMAADFANQVTKDLSAQNVNWQFKMPKDLKEFDRPDAGVLYVDKANYAAVKKTVLEYAKKHPEAFADGTPGFTKSIGKGIAVAEEPLQTSEMPKNAAGRYSFGGSRSTVIAETIMNAPAGATKQEIMALVRERMRSLGLNADRPWLQRGNSVDDL